MGTYTQYNPTVARMTAATIAAVTVAELHFAMGLSNRAHFEAGEEWMARANQLLVEQFGPDTGAALLARIVALSRYLDAGDGP